MKGSIFTNFEGAGTILYSPAKQAFVLGLSQKTNEFEYMGGKVEEGENPLETALIELTEETGSVDKIPIDNDGSKHILIFQPFSQKWIWCFVHHLTEEEEKTLSELDSKLDQWKDDELKDFYHLTKRKEKARKAVKGFYYIDKDAFFNYITSFINYKIKTDNRMKDAKVYGLDPETVLLRGKRLRNELETTETKLRGFNAVMFEQHLKKIKEEI